MAMSRKDYVAVAEEFAALVDGARRDYPAGSDVGRGYKLGLVHAINHVADVYAADNPRFDRYRFLTACKSPELFGVGA